MNAHEIRKCVATSGYEASCRCGWRGTWPDRDKRDAAVDKHLAGTR